MMFKKSLMGALAGASVVIAAPAMAQVSERSVLGEWTDGTGTNFVFESGGNGRIEQTRPINGNPGQIHTKIEWSINGAGNALTYKFISTTLIGSAGYDQTRPANGKSYTVDIAMNGSTLIINGARWRRK